MKDSFGKEEREWVISFRAIERPMAAKINPKHQTDAVRPVVLVAEDEFLVRSDIAEELRQLGCQAIEARNADEAIDALRSTCIDLVVTDLQMPGDRNGLDVARAARQEQPGMRIVVMSGHLLPIEEHRHLIDLFVSKPTVSDQLAKAILELINADTAKRDG